jgi:serine phosphatase RsbU (regulator of sigma subunit)
MIVRSLLYIILTSSLFTLQVSQGWAQVKNIGLPFIKNYTTDDYHAHDQNWFITQDRRGVIYVGNSSGVLEFDGVEWRLMELPNKSTARAVMLGQDGIVYVGGQNFVGYVDTDSRGSSYIVSLMDKVPAAAKGFKNIWNMIPSAQGVVCRSREALFILKNKQVKAIPAGNKTFSYLKIIKQQLYVTAYFGKRKIETYRVVDGTLEKTQGVLGKYNIFRSISLDKQKTLITRFKRLRIFDGKQIIPFLTQYKDFFAQNTVYSITKIDENHFAIGTSGGGIVIFNNTGQLIQHIHKGNGLQDNTVYTLYIDKNKNLWAGLSKGISFIELNSPFSVLDESSGLLGSVYYTQVHKQKLFLCTSESIFYKGWKVYEDPIQDDIKFKMIPGFLNQAWQIKAVKGKLLSTFNPGIIQLDGDFKENTKPQRIAEIVRNNWTIVELKNKPNLLLVGGLKGLALLEWKEKKWQIKHYIKGFSEDSRRVQVGDDPHNIWMSNDYNSVHKLTVNQSLDSIIKVTKYGKTKGFPADTYNRLFKINNQNLFATEDGIYVYDQVKDSIVREVTLNQLIGKHKMLLYMRSDAQQNIWYVAQSIHNGIKDKYLEVGLLQKQPTGSYQKLTQPFRKLRGSFIEKIAPHINPLDSSNVLFATKEGVVHFAPQKSRIKPKFSVLLRKILLIGNQDSVIFGGNFINKKGLVVNKPTRDNISPVFGYHHNSLRFNVSSTFYADNHKNEFRYRLKGLDSQWSPWTKETYRDYTNLSEGNYVLYIQTRNLYQEKSSIISYSFKVLPPWHRTIWAYIAYIVAGVVFVIIVIRLYTKRLKQQKLILEKKVQKRTVELQQKQEEILAQHQELQQQHEEITTQRDFIEQKNLQVQKSIEAAKLIQDAILPFDDRMQNIFAHYFVLFRPRDIVSGDFYWADKLKDGKGTKLAAAIDCTGHGVPGAFMSMIGYSLLNEIVHQQGVTQPRQILEKLRSELKHSLQKEKTKNQSGMDIALCKVNYQQDKSVKVVFAGARRPMYYFRAATQEFDEIKGNRISIGIMTKKTQPFQEQEITLQVGDVIYLTTDGYIDQNNAVRKSFGSNNLKKLLASNATLPLTKQKQILESQLDKYMENTTQRDDILIVGVKL